MENRPRRRIALAIESSEAGGAENVVLLLAEALRTAGHEPLIITQTRDWLTERAERKNLPLKLAPQRPGLDVGWVPRFAALLRRERIDLLHSHEFAMNVYGGAAALLAGIPSVATIHGHHWVADRARRRMAYRALSRLGMRIVAVSQDLAEFLSERLGLSSDRIDVIHNGIEFPARTDGGAKRRGCRERLRIPPESPVVAALGALVPVKDHAGLLRAVALVEGTHLLLAGEGPEAPRLHALAEQIGIADRVHLLGLRDDVYEILCAADVFAHPSIQEGLPLAILEAMAAGLPVVATAVGGIGEAVVAGETGLLVPARDPGALAAALGRLLRDPELRAKMGRLGRVCAEAEFSLEAMSRAYWDLYEAAWGAGGSARASA